MSADIAWFLNARFGLIIHYGLYSLLGRGEWVLNKEALPVVDYKTLADEFSAENFDADRLIAQAADWGMRYAVITAKHHDGFCLYDSSFTDFSAPKTAAGRDLVAEFVQACRKHGLRVGLYHSLNDWTAAPNSVDALERPEECYEPFIASVHNQIREIMTNYGAIDVMWYDGWWPFDAAGWRSEQLNAMVRELQPGILVNGRCCLPGDFSTPEKHVAASAGPWEACMTLNESWGYHRGDSDWKPPKAVAEMLCKCAAGRGNLLLNVGPMGDGTIPPESVACLDRVGKWLKANGEAIYGDTIRFEIDPRQRGDARADWTSHGAFTARSDAFYWHISRWPGRPLRLAGVECDVRQVTELATGRRLAFVQEAGTVVLEDVPEAVDTTMPVVLKFATADVPRLYQCGGLRQPDVPHCRYDPVTPEIVY